MQDLNLPAFEPQLRKRNGQVRIFDVVRRKYVRLTPEEWVRQHIIHFLLQKNYPGALMQVERMHEQHTLRKRSDILVFDRTGTPLLLVECKSPFLKLNEAMLRQVLIYNQHFRATFVMLSNGLTHHYWQRRSGELAYQKLGELPDFAAP